MRKITGAGAVVDLRRRLQLLQRGSGLTLENLAYKTGMSKTDLSEMTGIRPPRWEDLVTFVHACGGHPDDYRSAWTAAMDEFTNSAAPGNSGRHLQPAWDTRELDGQLRYLAGPPPSPVTCTTPAEFNSTLRRVKEWAPRMTVRKIANATKLSTATIQAAIGTPKPGKPERLPKQEIVVPILQACGITEENMLKEWLFTWRRIKATEGGPPGKADRRHLRIV